MLTSPNHLIKAQTYWLPMESGHTQIGEAIETPAGILVWGHDFDEPDDAGYCPLYLDTADDWNSAADKVEHHARQAQGA